MTHLRLFWPFKKISEAWLESHKSELQKKLDEELVVLRAEKASLLEAEQARIDSLKDRESEFEEKELKLHLKQLDLESTEKMVEDRKVELERVNEELKTQIRLIEAKASPSEVWAQAFTAGFGKAWDMMLPLMSDGLDKTRKVIEDKAISDTLKGLEGHIVKRIEEAGKHNVKSANELIAKKAELKERISKAKTKEEINKLTHYGEALDWILNANTKSN